MHNGALHLPQGLLQEGAGFPCGVPVGLIAAAQSLHSLPGLFPHGGGEPLGYLEQGDPRQAQLRQQFIPGQLQAAKIQRLGLLLVQKLA